MSGSNSGNRVLSAKQDDPDVDSAQKPNEVITKATVPDNTNIRKIIIDTITKEDAEKVTVETDSSQKPKEIVTKETVQDNGSIGGIIKWALGEGDAEKITVVDKGSN